MNNVRRNDIKLAMREIEIGKNMLDRVLGDEEDAFDNMPENLQSSTRGMESEEAQDILSEAIDALEEVLDLLRDIK